MLAEEISLGRTPGDAIPGYDGIVFKVRRNNRTVPGGPRRGYRFIYCIHSPNQATMLSVYAKTEQTDISDGEIAQLLQEADRLLASD